MSISFYERAKQDKIGIFLARVFLPAGSHALATHRRRPYIALRVLRVALRPRSMMATEKRTFGRK